MVSSFDPHSMCAKVERITEKAGCTSCTNWTTLSKYEGFKRKLICFKGISFLLSYFNSRLFLHPTCNIQSHIPKFHKLDHLFQNTRVSDENSYVSKAFHFY